MEMETLKGRLEDIRFQGNNFWSVATLRTDRGHQVTIVGNLLTSSPGDSLKLSGKWRVHPSHGRQFEFRSFEVLTPSTNEGVVGADKVFEILEKAPGRLTEIAGITPERARRIGESYGQQAQIRDTLVFLKRFRLTDGQAARIIEKYGTRARDVLKENPYQLIDDIDGFGFKTVDEIARRIGVDHHGVSRAKAGCIYVLRLAQDKGNTFAPRDEFRRQVVKELAIAGQRVDEAVNILVESGAAVVEGDRIYSRRLYDVEVAVAAKLSELARSEGTP
jgi:exodeoxyribonuclease V alpha subunit